MRSILRSRRAAILAAMLAATLLLGSLPVSAQASGKEPGQQAPPAAGGPQGDVGPIVLPKKKEQPPEPEAKPAKPKDLPEFSMKVEVPLVTLDVTVTTKEGIFIDNLRAGNFRVLEDGVPQKITSFNRSEKPITAVLLVEFARTYGQFLYDAVNASYAFANSLKKEDWVAVVAFDMRPEILVDFTQDKRAIYDALRQLRVPGFSEINTFDALYDTLERLEGVEGRKYVILVGTGLDTFSRKNLDEVLAKVKEARDVQIFTITTGRVLRDYVAARAGGNWNATLANMDYLQAENQMRAFARLTGGQSYYPRFFGELRDIFADIGNAVRNQYTLAYHPTNSKQDGSYRKLKVELVDATNGGPLRVVNEKGKDIKYVILAREGYRAKHEVE